MSWDEAFSHRHDEWSAAMVIVIDTSPAMPEQARERADARGAARRVRGRAVRREP